MVRKLFKYLGIGFLATMVFLSGILMCIAAAECGRGRVMLVNALDVDQPALRLFGKYYQEATLWSGPLERGGVKEIFLQARYGDYLQLEGTNAATGEKFLESSGYITSVAPYGTYLFVIGPNGVRTITAYNPSPKEGRSVYVNILRLALQHIYYQARCVDEDLANWWAG
ncbi:MAG: hypothetical protein HOM58_14820 [Rhodospirillaceae bacterium]|mgnify:CR=1 FL=1|jgi:hypothetical protein|nr:hypothetical protein [Rhodospirillaceae bacterium]